MKRKIRLIAIILILLTTPVVIKAYIWNKDQIDGGECKTCGKPNPKPKPKPPTPTPTPTPQPPEPNCYYTICTRTRYETKYRCSRGKSSYPSGGSFVDGGSYACHERTVSGSSYNPGSCSYCHYRTVYR